MLLLALSSLFNFGFVSEAKDSHSQKQLKEVLVQAHNTPPEDVVVEKVIGPDGGGLGKILYPDESDRLSGSGAAIVAIGEGMLKRNAIFKFTISPENTTAYPDASFMKSVYPIDKLEYIGPLATLEIPSASLNLDSPEDQLLFTISPSFYKGALDRVKQRDIRLEVRIPLEDGDMVFHTMRFGYTGEAPIWSELLKASFGNDLPETVKISVQAVDISRALPNPEDLSKP